MLNIRPDLAKVPGYYDAVVDENNIRDAAFCDLPAIICGRRVMQLNCWHWLVLNAIDSPFLVGRMPTPGEAVVFLWVTSREFWFWNRVGVRNHKTRFMQWRRKRFGRNVGTLPYGDLAVGINKLVEQTFQDAPAFNDDNMTGVPSYSFCAGLVHSLATTYHWTEQQILALPLKRSFQYQKAIDIHRQARNGDNPVAFNPSDAQLRKGREMIREQMNWKPEPSDA